MRNLVKILILTITVVFCSCESLDEHFDSPINTVSKNGITVSVYTESPNSVGGVSVKCKVVNHSNKIIKYMFIDVVMLNYFGDRVYCDITDSSYAGGLKITGPINPGASYNCKTSDLFYNWNATQCHITHCSVEFTDGTEFEILK